MHPSMPNPQALVSVVLATNRTSPYLAEALASVRVQTYRHVELIVVDDGSPDPQAIRAAAQHVSGTRVVRQQASGVSVARNNGVAHARGAYLAFLDDDDRWHPERLERQVATMEAGADAAVASYCGMRTIGMDGEVLVDADQHEVEGRLGIARRDTGIILPNLIVRASAFATAGGFHTRIRQGEDLDLVLRLAELGPFVWEPGVLVDYRAHGTNTTGRYRELYASIDRVVRLHRAAARDRADRELVDALDESLRKNDRFAWWSAGRAARAAVRDRHPASAVRALAWALRVAPRGLADGIWRRVRGIRA